MNRERKRPLVVALLAHLEAEIATMRRAAGDARAAATHEEAKPENDKDTRALEASYLAAGQAERVRELEAAAKTIASLELRALGRDSPIQASAVVTVEDEGGARSTFFLAPHGGGAQLSLDGAPVQVLTPQSPLGRAILGRTCGDVVELPARGKTRELEIVDVW